MDFRTLAVLHAVPTLFLTGLIWFVQVAHYPLFAKIGPEYFVAYERAYTPRVGYVVMPTMLAEVALAVLVWWRAPAELQAWTLAGLVALAVVWLSTFLLQVPCHNVLSERADPAVMERLVAGNWLRTAAWTCRGGIATLLLLRC
ncbi:MAG: hypothetical protein RL398_2402 [Planctomycetota bacterium]|jgi:hypothetical protein